MLDPRPALRFYSADTAFRAAGRQTPHIDTDIDLPRIPFRYCVNINLVDTSAENGSTEMWLGSHADTSVAILNKDKVIRRDLLEQRRRISPPIQPSLLKGSLVIRDFRL